MARPTADQLAAKRRTEILSEIETVALEGAPAAMRTLTAAAGGGKVPREALQAAVYLLNQVWGKPADKEPVDTKHDALRGLLADLKAVRTRPGRG